MPRPGWRHYCIPHKKELRTGEEVCPECGVRGRFDGWKVSLIERMGMYQRRTGMKPMGPHRVLTDLLLDPMLKECDHCQGDGVVTLADESWSICPRCQGLMFVRTVDAALYDETRRRIAREFPEEAVSGAAEVC